MVRSIYVCTVRKGCLHSASLNYFLLYGILARPSDDGDEGMSGGLLIVMQNKLGEVTLSEFKVKLIDLVTIRSYQISSWRVHKEGGFKDTYYTKEKTYAVRSYASNLPFTARIYK